MSLCPRIIQVWTETPTGGTVNFLTGVGGFLQTVLYGLPGLRLHADSMRITPQLIPSLGMTQLVVRGLHYQGVRFTFAVNASHTSFLRLAPAGPSLVITPARGGALRLNLVGQRVAVVNNQTLKLTVV